MGFPRGNRLMGSVTADKSHFGPEWCGWDPLGKATIDFLPALVTLLLSANSRLAASYQAQPFWSLTSRLPIPQRALLSL